MNRTSSKFRYLTISNPLLQSVRFNSQLVVTRLSFYTTHEKLRSLFSPFGNVKEAKLIMDPKTGRPKGFGFVTFESEAEAKEALKALNNRIVDGRLIFVEFARTSKTDGEGGSHQD